MATQALRSGEVFAVNAARPSFESGRRDPRSLPLSHRTRGSLVRPAGTAWEKVLAARAAGPTACRCCLMLLAAALPVCRLRCTLCSVLNQLTPPSNPFHGALRAFVLQYLFYRYCMRVRQVRRWNFLGFAPGLLGAPSESVQVRGVGYPTRGHLGLISLPSRRPASAREVPRSPTGSADVERAVAVSPLGSGHVGAATGRRP